MVLCLYARGKCTEADSRPLGRAENNGLVLLPDVYLPPTRDQRANCTLDAPLHFLLSVRPNYPSLPSPFGHLFRGGITVDIRPHAAREQEETDVKSRVTNRHRLRGGERTRAAREEVFGIPCNPIFCQSARFATVCGR